MSLLVLEPGLDSRIVDAGRLRSRSFGVPVGGAADRSSLALGNALLGNEPDAAALEITLKGPRLRAGDDTACVLVGAPFEATLDGYPVPAGRTFTFRADTELRIGGTPRGARAYLCVRGGFDLPIILQSRSALAPLQKDETLPCRVSTTSVRFCPDILPVLADHAAIATLPGLQTSWFDADVLRDREFTVTPASNRMGLRLKGIPLTLPKRELTSEPVCPGAVQVTNDGQCIILGIDGQTIGGYPKIAQVILADLDLLGQLRPGQKIRFHTVSMEEATARDRQHASELKQRIARLRLAFDALG